ncbi:Spermidine/putrescine import ATP-binding protein PotA [Bradyrhizobium ivorense]|uniref:Spermidine/putrescine import ATP-binding protein PotA n=1 Tax=Bradyrhizobium ivorense TaxID=2511166 RepID=A0A508T5A1_9BRAD|nr:ABC transporter ATP-binding protein [Bradyrhizobium ivorense]VIO70572.1 Spermidine/putrescine import ATP-binding protein PotA [Bradyrhizobium ivorense]
MIQSTKPFVSRGGTELRLEGVTKLYAGTAAVDRLDLTVAQGEFVTLLGASGSGKTTTLMMLAGFTQADSGRISIGGRDVTALPPGKRNLGVVFQNYSLFPHLTVAQNLAFPLEMRKLGRAEIKDAVLRALEIVHLPDKAERYPRELSGGQQQRVALARAIIFHPQALLMDEPLGALDKNLREHMQIEIKRLHASLGATIVFVTHDQEEALTMSNRVAVMDNGKIAQIASPRAIYEEPLNRFVASFIGQSNFLPGKVLGGRGDGFVVQLTTGDKLNCRGPHQPAPGDEVLAVVRPEHIAVYREAQIDGHRKTISGKVVDTLYLGHTIKLEVCLADGTRLMTQSTSAALDGVVPPPGSAVQLDLGSRSIWCIPAVEEAK